MTIRTFCEVYDQLGEYMTRGSSRRVFAHATKKHLVVKMCDAGDFSNVREYDVWDRFRYCGYISKWLAPCVEISECGRLLVQRRTNPLHDVEVPYMVPNWTTDWKKSNWGILIPAPEDWPGLPRFPVTHDYASHLLLEKGATRRMQKAKWRKETADSAPAPEYT